MLSKFFKIDWFLLVSACLLLFVGILALYSISTSESRLVENVFLKQSLFAGISLLVLIFFAFFDHRYLKSYSTALYFLTLAILILVLIIGRTVRGTSGWIGIGPFHIQPAELAKLTLIVFLASFISQKRSELGSVVRLVASAILSGGIILLVLKQPDFGSAMILCGIWLGMILLSGIEKKHIMGLILLGAVVSAVGWTMLAPYQKARISNFISPDNDPRGSGYNVIQSIIAVGSGGLIGKGIGNGSQSQLNFLPEKHTDFIFAMIAEELGLLGSVFVFGLFFIFFYRVRRIAIQSTDNFGYLLASGIFIMTFFQMLVNIGMNIGLMPVTGIPLPFVSYGGSSLITMFAAVGILLNIYFKKSNNRLSSIGAISES